MLVSMDLNSNEETVLNSLRSSDAYKARNFKENCHKHLNAINNLVESAKIYILDNYKNVQDYSELGLNLRYHTGNQIFGLKDKKRIEENRLKRISELTGIAKKLHEISIPDTSRTRSKFLEEYRIKREKNMIQIESFSEAVYDWTDGDFSIVLNGKWYLWIDKDSILQIAAFIEKQINTDEIKL